MSGTKRDVRPGGPKTWRGILLPWKVFFFWDIDTYLLCYLNILPTATQKKSQKQNVQLKSSVNFRFLRAVYITFVFFCSHCLKLSSFAQIKLD